jgi:poly-beta-1,6-N-acetyl-D-glucosamine synthase
MRSCRKDEDPDMNVSAHTKYVIISPVRDEEKYIEKTISSMLAQTVKPVEWIIVDDGSRDSTGVIIDGYASQYKWIRVMHRHDRGFRKAGGGVIEAFYEGYRSLKSDEWEFLVKLDGDLSFESTYFERCFHSFRRNPKLGIGGGTIYNLVNDHEEIEKTPLFHVRGATKIYRKQCWTEINGLIVAPGWDTVDELKANMIGWQTHTFPDLKVVQLKFTGAAEGRLRDLVKGGTAAHISGYHPLFMLARSILRVFSKPYVVGGIALLYGYIVAYFKAIPRIQDKKMIQYLRQQQLRRLLFRESIWK